MDTADYIRHIDVTNDVDGDTSRAVEVILAVLVDIVSVTVELLNAVIIIYYINIAGSVCGDALRVTELTVSGAKVTPFSEIGPVTVELLNAVIVTVCNINIAGSVGGDAPRITELTVSGGVSPPLSDVRTGIAKLLDTVIA